MNWNTNNSFFCSVPANDLQNFAVSAVPVSDAVIRIVRPFSCADYWNAAVPSVKAGFLPVGDFFAIRGGIAEYYLRDTDFAASLCITVSSIRPPAPAKRPFSPSRFLRHEVRYVRRFSCGNLSRKCTALTL